MTVDVRRFAGRLLLPRRRGASSPPGSTGSSTAGCPTAPPAAVLRAADRAGRRARRPAGPRARLAGRRPLRRPQLGAVVGARRRAGDRPRRSLQEMAYDDGDRHRPRLAGRPGRQRAGAVPRTPAAASSPAATAPPSGSAASCCRAGRAGTRAAGAGRRSTSTAVDVVTADGELVRADSRQNSDLYWAARGAGPGFFGVVTRFHLRTLPAPRHIAQTVQAYPLDDFDEVMTWLHGMHDTVADTVEIVALTKTDRALVRPAGAAGHRRGAGRRRGRGGRGAGAVPRPTRPWTGRCWWSTPHPPRSTSSASGSCVDNPEGHRWAVDNAWLSGPVERRACRRCAAPTRRCRTTRPSRSGSAWRRCARLPDMAFSLQSEIYLRQLRAVAGPGRRRATTRHGCATAMADLRAGDRRASTSATAT